MTGFSSSSDARHTKTIGSRPLAGSSIFLGAAVLEAGRGGIARVARMTATALVAEGGSPSITALHDQKSERFGDCRSTGLRGNRLLFAARSYLAALGTHHFIYDSAGIARAHPRLPGLRRPYCVWMHGIEVWDGLRPVHKKVLQHADLLLVNSHYTKERVCQMHGDFSRAKVCWLATEQDDRPQRSADFNGPPTALILGRIVDGRDKGHDAAIACWPDVVSAVPDARLLIAGTGPGLARLQKKAERSGVGASIEFAGFVPDERIDEIWRRAHVYFMPSRTEGFGLVYIEAMRHGVPVIASIHDAGQEVNVDGVTGYNVDLDDQAGMTARLVDLLKNNGRAKKMGAAGQRRWQQYFCFSAFANRLRPILTGFVGNAP